MNYTLNVYGWSAEFIGKTITKEQTKQIEDLMVESETEDVTDVRYDVEEVIVMDIYDGDLLSINKPFKNENLFFELLNENGQMILTFNIEDIENVYGDNSYGAFPTEENDVWFSVDEYKGGICSYEFESEEVPTIQDFKYTLSDVETPDDYWEIIDEIMFKGGILECNEPLDNNGKYSKVEIYKN
jgi:hypothetical protein